MEGDQISKYIKTAGLSWPLHQRMIAAYYGMNAEASSTGPLVIMDSSEYNNFGNATAVRFVEVSTMHSFVSGSIHNRQS